jgi:hypothetical protein
MKITNNEIIETRNDTTGRPYNEKIRDMYYKMYTIKTRTLQTCI